jgi:hypothetical protein
VLRAGADGVDWPQGSRESSEARDARQTVGGALSLSLSLSRSLVSYCNVSLLVQHSRGAWVLCSHMQQQASKSQPHTLLEQMGGHMAGARWLLVEVVASNPCSKPISRLSVSRVTQWRHTGSVACTTNH